MRFVVPIACAKEEECSKSGKPQQQVVLIFRSVGEQPKEKQEQPGKDRKERGGDNDTGHTGDETTIQPGHQR